MMGWRLSGIMIWFPMGIQPAKGDLRLRSHGKPVSKPRGKLEIHPFLTSKLS